MALTPRSQSISGVPFIPCDMLVRQLQREVYYQIYALEEGRMFGLGTSELILILIIALIVFGPSKLPSLGKGLGEAIRGFKKGLEEEKQKPEK